MRGTPRLTRLLYGITLAIAVATVIAMAVLWPGRIETRIGGSLANDSYKAKVESVGEVTCPGSSSQSCQVAKARLRSGPDSGRLVTLELSNGNLDPDLDAGDDILVTEATAPSSGVPTVGSGYTLYDFQRGHPMLLLTALF